MLSRAEIPGWTGGSRAGMLLVPVLVALGLVLAPMASPLAAPGPAAGPVTPVAVSGQAEILEAERRRTAETLAALADEIQLTEDTIRALDGEIDALSADRGRIRQAMVEAAAAQKTASRDIVAAERRIEALAGDEALVKASLRERRGLLAEVLGALQRMGRKPPPALLVKPEDALGSVRSAILLGAVVPGIRRETEKLADDLGRLAALKVDIAAEKQRFVDGQSRQKQEEGRLARLFAETERLEADNRGRREAQSLRVAELAGRATSLQDLIETLEAEAENARVAEAAARRAAALKAEAERQAAADRAAAEAEAAALRRAAAIRQAELRPQGPDERGTPESREVAALAPPQPALAAPPAAAIPPPPAVIAPPAPPPTKTYDVASLRRDMARIDVSAPFSTMKGRLSTPVAGAVQTGYGVGDGIGRPSSGVTFEARAGDLVTAPADGQVIYCGPFRSYGQLLILNAGDGYHIVLAGMSEIDVAVGQVVISGEPLAVMGAQRVASAAGADFSAAEPSLYVEFRKDGKPVDPTPWWTDGPSGRTRNDS